MGVLEQFGFPGAGELLDALATPDKVIQMGRPPNRIDLLTLISGVEFDEALAGCVATGMDGVPIRMLGRAALLKKKRESGRAKDLAEVDELEKTDPGGRE